MLDFPHPWGEYAALQSKLKKKTQIDDESWGLEAALDRILEVEAQPTVQEIERVRKNTARRERYRARVLRFHVVIPRPWDVSLEEQFDARKTLIKTKEGVEENDWRLLCAVGDGFTYEEMATRVGSTSGALRTRVSRLRNVFAVSP